MAYFLKQTRLKGRTYLAIYEGHYDHDRKGAVNRTVKSLGSVETLKAGGMEDPVAFYRAEVGEMNRKRTEQDAPKIGKASPAMHLGYFPLKAIMERLHVRRLVDAFSMTNDFEYDLYGLLCALVYARAVGPASKRKTFHSVVPRLFEKREYSYDQMLDCCAFLGRNYEKFAELFLHQTKAAYGINTGTAYFDCTNFYFEIDRQDGFRRKGPGKEGRPDPIVGMGLLLDRDLVPIGLRLYPGNQPEKPVLGRIIRDLKRRHQVVGRTIHVADKGLNCAENIALSRERKDGYLFSKSVKTLPETEKVWVLLKDGYKEVTDSKGKLLYAYKSCIDEFPYTFEAGGKKVSYKVREKRLVTFNPQLARKQRMEIDRLALKAASASSPENRRAVLGECSRFVSFIGRDGAKADAVINQDAIEKAKRFAGFNMLVTSELDMDDKAMYRTYHHLWRIEETFRVMKTDLDARPVFLQKEDSIKGHFLICYITVLLTRILQFKILRNQFPTSAIIDLFRNLDVVKVDGKYLNTASDTKLIESLAEHWDIPINNLFLSDVKIKRILGVNPRPFKEC